MAQTVGLGKTAGSTAGTRDHGRTAAWSDMVNVSEAPPLAAVERTPLQTEAASLETNPSDVLVAASPEQPPPIPMSDNPPPTHVDTDQRLKYAWMKKFKHHPASPNEVHHPAKLVGTCWHSE